MFLCPHCGKPGIKPLRKVILSPGLLANCQACSEVSSISYKPWLIGMIPGTILMLAALFVDSEVIEWSLNIVGLLLMIVIPFLFAPLHKETL